jgi:hypothetical protein
MPSTNDLFNSGPLASSLPGGGFQDIMSGGGSNPLSFAGSLPGGGFDDIFPGMGGISNDALGGLFNFSPGGGGGGAGDIFKSVARFDPILGGLFGGDEDKPKKPYWQRLANREWAQGNAVLSAFNRLYEPTLALAQRSAADYGRLWRAQSNEQLAHELTSATAKRSGDLADYSRLGPEYIRMMRESNPLLGQIYDSAQSDLRLGTDLDPETAHQIQESVRKAQAARGFGLGPSDVFQEAVTTAGFGDQYRRGLKQERLGNAYNAAGLFGDVFQATTGRPSQSPAPVGSNIEGPRIGTQWDDLLSYGIGRETQGRNLRAANSAANKAMIGQIVGGLLGAAGGAAGALCWVAREVFGEDNPQWQLFRQWLIEHSPDRFYAWYLTHGERFADRLKDPARANTKARLRVWMEAKIAELRGQPVRKRKGQS